MRESKSTRKLISRKLISSKTDLLTIFLNKVSTFQRFSDIFTGYKMGIYARKGFISKMCFFRADLLLYMGRPCIVG